MNILASVVVLGTLVVLGVVVFRRGFSYRVRLAAAVLFWTLLLTPSLAPATIAVYPVPFGVLLAVGVFAAVMHEIVELVVLFQVWHLISFPVTALVVYLVARKVLSNSSSSGRESA